MYKLILASASARRSQILSEYGISFEVIKSDCEEYTEFTKPSQVVTDLSLQKARDVAKKAAASEKYVGQDILVLSADTIVSYNGEILGKPVDEQDAFDMLSLLSGRTHEVYTGVTLMKNDEVILNFAACSVVEFYEVSPFALKEYIATGDPLDKAGSYGIQGPFGLYVKGIRGEYNNIVGLPAAELYQRALEAGIDLKHDVM
ncbi:MAG: septum formation protein Maf [Lachnospiraceae bacterium]|nr:septum formation protein Maf [Lachnospiraceae bacterium]